MIAALVSEIAMLRQRLDTLERVLAANGTLAAGAIEAFIPNDAARAARAAQRHRLIDKVFGPVRNALAAARETRP